MPHQKLLLLMIWVWLVVTISTLWWNFPLQDVARPECRWTTWDELTESCKIDIVQWSQQQDIGKLLFSALRWTSYEKSQTANSGGHPSLDLPSSEWTPVYAIHEWTVINASERGGYWLSITIQHELDWKKIFSNYSHLSELLVKKWDSVKGKTLIWKVWCTGFSISGDPTRCGNHLDFQITTDKSPSHPYWYWDCEDWYFWAVEKWTCREKLLAYTIDPLVFFASYSDVNINYPVIAPHVVKKDNEVHNSADEDKPTKPTPPKAEPAKAEPAKKSLSSILALLRAQNATKKETTTNATTVEAKPTTTVPVKTLGAREAKIGDYFLDWSWNQEIDQLQSFKIVSLTMSVKDSLWNAFQWALPNTVKIKIDNESIGSLFPEQFSAINTESKYIFLQTKNPGSALVSIRYGDTKIAEEMIVVK